MLTFEDSLDIAVLFLNLVFCDDTDVNEESDDEEAPCTNLSSTRCGFLRFLRTRLLSTLRATRISTEKGFRIAFSHLSL